VSLSGSPAFLFVHTLSVALPRLLPYDRLSYSFTVYLEEGLRVNRMLHFYLVHMHYYLIHMRYQMMLEVRLIIRLH
jgi:hypothetical protein